MMLRLLSVAALGSVVFASYVNATEPPKAEQTSSVASSATPKTAVEDFKQLLPPDTPVRLMILKEITSRTAHSGDRFKLRVDEPIFINGKAVVPVGTTAWGEIVSLEANGAAGKAGRLGAKLLWLELPDGRVPLKGEMKRKGGGNGDGLAMAIVGFGIFGLLNAGDSARFKAGDLFTAFVAEVAPPAAAPVSPSTSAPIAAASAP